MSSRAQTAVTVIRGVPHNQHRAESKMLTRDEYWALQESDSHTNEGFIIEGITDVEVAVELTSRGPAYTYQLATGVYGPIQIPRDFIFPNDHLVVEGVWFPLDDDTIRDLEAFDWAVEAGVGELLSRQELSELIRLSNSSNVRVIFKNSLAELFSATVETHSFSYNLALEPWAYQRLGINWLLSLFSHGMGGILADQMGLGKTIQMLGLISAAVEEAGARTLIVVPNSLRLNWEKEIHKFAPTLRYVTHHGPSRMQQLSALENEQVILTTYDLLTYDEHNFSRLTFDLVVFDEAHALKSPTSKRRKVAAQLNSARKFLCTGTPFENSLNDLWSLIDIVQPRILGTRRYFDGIVAADIRKARELGEMVSPLILRRTMEQVDSDIPESHESVEYFQLDDSLIDIYESLRTKQHPETLGTHGWGIATKLRMFLTEPCIFDDFNPGEGQKFERLCEVLDEIWFFNEKVLVFVPYLDAIDGLARVTGTRFSGTRIFSVDGRSNADERFNTVERFQQQEGFAVLFANPRAAGQGLNIQKANHVIHYAPDWNPAQQDQATFRVLRPGQEKKVHVHRFIYSETIEEVMNDALLDKRDVAKAALAESEAEGSSKSLDRALSLSPRRKPE